MKPRDLALLCKAVINQQGPNADVIITLPWDVTTGHARINRTTGPTGNVVPMIHPEGKTNVAFNCEEVLEWLRKAK